MHDNEKYFIVSNLQTYLEIAKESYEESIKYLEKNRTLKPDGGYVIKLDPDKRSFKNALISIAFSGSYIDLYLRLAYVVKNEDEPPREWKFNNPYHKKLKFLGVTDDHIIGLCEKFREVRNDVAHEKPIILGLTSSTLSCTAQEGAKIGIDLIEAMRAILPLFPKN